MYNKTTILQQVKQVFSVFLTQNNSRKTIARFAILEAIYSYNKHFDVETLHSILRKEKKIVSKATLYNTIELLLACHLIRKNLFGKSSSIYEPAYIYKQHDHIVCVECNQVTEFYEPHIEQIKTSITKKHDIEILHHSLYLYGICNKCNKHQQ